jgi:hypothetical protein
MRTLTCATRWCARSAAYRRANGPGLLFLAVPDGYTQAALGGHRTSIANNLAVIPPVPHDRTLEISGRTVPTVTFDLDRHLPPGLPRR